MRLPYPWLVLVLAGGMPTGDVAESAPLPTTAAGWSIELLAQAPLIHAPTAVLETSEGLLFLAQDPMDLNGPATEPIDYIVTLRRVNGQLVRTVSRKIWARSWAWNGPVTHYWSHTHPC